MLGVPCAARAVIQTWPDSVEPLRAVNGTSLTMPWPFSPQWWRRTSPAQPFIAFAHGLALKSRPYWWPVLAPSAAKMLAASAWLASPCWSSSELNSGV